MYITFTMALQTYSLALISTYLDKAQHIPSWFEVWLQNMDSRPKKGWG